MLSKENDKKNLLTYLIKNPGPIFHIFLIWHLIRIDSDLADKIQNINISNKNLFCYHKKKNLYANRIKISDRFSFLFIEGEIMWGFIWEENRCMGMGIRLYVFTLVSETPVIWHQLFGREVYVCVQSCIGQ